MITLSYKITGKFYNMGHRCFARPGAALFPIAGYGYSCSDDYMEVLDSGDHPHMEAFLNYCWKRNKEFQDGAAAVTGNFNLNDSPDLFLMTVDNPFGNP